MAPLRFPLDPVEGFEGVKLVLEMENVFAPARLWQNGRLVENGPTRGTFVLRRRDGVEVLAISRRHMLDPVPQLVIQGKIVRAVQPYQFWEWLLMILPLLLASAGIPGTIFGAVALWINARILRMERPAWQRAAMTLAVSAGALVVFLVVNAVVVRMQG